MSESYAQAQAETRSNTGSHACLDYTLIRVSFWSGQAAGLQVGQRGVWNRRLILAARARFEARAGKNIMGLALLQMVKDTIDLGGHNEVVLVQSFDLLRAQ
jgi:hypothetical protein